MPTAPDTFRPLRIGILCHPTYGGSGVVASELALTLAGKSYVTEVRDILNRLAQASVGLRIRSEP